jgi:Carboxypeptidase regulatory-like domain
MNLDRRASLLSVAAVAVLALFAWWALHPTETPIARQQVTATAPQPEAAPAATPAVDVTAHDEAATDPATAFATFRGRVVDAVTRAPVREFELTFVGTQQTKVGDEAPGSRKFRTNDGRFEWQYLPPGRWSVIADAQGYQRFEIEGLTLVKGQSTAEGVLPLRRGHEVRGRIYDETTNAGVAAATITSREANTGRFEGNWRTRSSATSAKDGSFVLNGVPAGRMTLEASASDYAPREIDVVVGDETAPVEIGLSSGATIAGRLTAADGVTPIAGMAGLYKVDKEMAGGIGRTGPAGEFAFRNLMPGTWRLVGRASGGSATRDFVVTGNERMEGVVLALRTGRTIRGRVTGVSSADLKQVNVMVQRDGDMTLPDEVPVNERGEYELRGVQPGHMRLVADVASRRQFSRTVDVPADADIVANIDFPRGATLSGRVTHAGKPLAQVQLDPVSTATDSDLYIYGVATSATGEYAIQDLPPGEYFIRIGPYRTHTIRVAGDTVFDIDVPTVQVAGRVLEEDGEQPVVAADIVAWATQADASAPHLRDSSDHFGQFGLAGFESGEFLVTAYKPGYEMVRQRITYSAPIRDLTIRLRRDAGVELSAHDAASGKALEYVYAFEVIGDHNGSQLVVRLDEDGIGHLPRALSGTTLAFSADGYLPQTIAAWEGDRLDLKLVRKAIF